MTVAELIEQLKKLPQDLAVYADGVTDECEWGIGDAKQKIISIRYYLPEGGHLCKFEQVVLLGTGDDDDEDDDE